MGSSGHDFFSNVRSKLRQSRSSLLMPTSSSRTDLTTSGPEVEPWGQIPIEYRPVERANVRPPSEHYVPYRPLPGPPPRPRTTSPAAVFRPKLRIDTGNGPYTKPKEYRRRSDQCFSTGVPERSSRIHHPDQQARDRRKSMSVEIAAALLPDHLDPPPPYSPPPEPPTQYSHSQTRPRSYQAYHQPSFVRPYDPRDYVSTTSSTQSTYHPSNTSRAMMEVPMIEASEPTPVSPINSLDQQYLALRRRGPRITVDSLLAHPMLQR
ncbi:hypothetical protein RBB50_012746 [Rhinocladiella similis]